ncbi:alanine dehydrogenase [Hazenella sp. IB182357]|uniref:Alanine dehydrogenase n=1 Tax=Polycladospora coralii TaxID=2771432 RepID=A0A926NAG8_9BACL|nr:alanine dehydrogenase [Polycladospora coralii]MBD1372025.1 alanine dehydrogenase [Polycladospora coralii]MBS7530531.1 alanine dehydrogenase [Polycladospora coralii]
MKIGVPKEVKNNEYRVGLTPAAVDALIEAGHQVVIEEGAGEGSGFFDLEYLKAGAQIGRAIDAWEAELVIKVKEPIPTEYSYFREGLKLFTYLHLAANEMLTKALKKEKVTAVAYETVQTEKGTLPLLAPMSEVAGRMSIQVGAQCLEKRMGGSGIVLGGVPGVKPARVMIVGGGVVGTQAAKVAVGMGAEVSIFDVNANRLRQLDDLFNGRTRTLMSTKYALTEEIQQADLVIGAVLIPGKKAPRLVTRDMVTRMRSGSVIVDVAIDQGGCIETADHVTTHDQPTYMVDGVVHYAVANIPGAVPRTSTIALNNQTLPYILKLAKGDLTKALLAGFNVIDGHITCKGVAEAFSFPYTAPESVLQQSNTYYI